MSELRALIGHTAEGVMQSCHLTTDGDHGDGSRSSMPEHLVSDDLREQFDQAIEKVKSFCVRLETAIEADSPTIVHMAQNAAYEWGGAYSVCRRLFAEASSDSIRSYASAARRVLESQCRVIMDQLVRASRTPVGACTLAELQRLAAQLIKVSNSPLV